MIITRLDDNIGLIGGINRSAERWNSFGLSVFKVKFCHQPGVRVAAPVVFHDRKGTVLRLSVAVLPADNTSDDRH